MRTATSSPRPASTARLLSLHAGEAPVHGLRVALIAASVAAQLGVDVRRRHRVATAGLLHDLGKATLPREVCEKSGPLTDAEWELMRGHPGAGERIAELFTDDGEVLGAIRSHHERWEGGGYPDGLAGAEIPEGARIVAVADAFAAMTEERPYRPAASFAHALLELRRERGRQFEPDCVDAFEAAFAVLRGRRGAGRPPAPELGRLLHDLALELA